ncbi:PatA/PatG family cyanobactin maturation protease [Nodularia spumigena CS-588/02]|uniref:S8 family peptidase n=1 Tax=Nodularia spumigena TaxID=70799 RepID=UPI00232F8897|nr:PatA/PatG family cyanobactin maturation protease [Nodularia spumigena]MDB9348029.1 PatA/PatG family cyanobactin maturation protease [Nodularia spumigena CS-588/01]MDB9353305.1 PatA/PatG family cyanobactin maturation protease [Nodularia spumigena CS-588/05]MDB9362193.1 PatA/PatG family cyanobactin maturation protease [Nodularia spumigena CS-588/02]MDB9365211.1 PatA/PatG family cyanobactin maturation protease [Nodularia spumigena CS-588/02A10]
MPDLTDIPGISQIWTRTKGDPRIKIAILDGAADLERSCFQGANFSQFQPYWSEDIELNEEYFYYLNLFLEFNQQQKDKKDDPDHDKEEAKKEREAFFAPFHPAIRQRIELSSHATHISSTILGQHGTPAPGIAPLCTALNIPISFAGDDFISPINLTHAINTAFQWGANIIHIAACHPTQTGVAPDLFARAVKQCQENNMLIVAPGGNDKGECWCIPSILPGVITVGAMRDDGQPFKFSNYGGEYQNKGVMANGENILGAQPGTEEPIREKGTSCAAPIVTGISALLMSMQLQRGEQPNAEAVRQAILNSAIPCNPEEVEEPERCLLGKFNIPGAFQLLTGERLEPHLQPLSLEERGVKISRSHVLPGNATSEALPLTIPSGRALEKAFPAGDWERETGVAVATIERKEITEGVAPSAASKLVYALGTIGYDFGDEARRDSFKQLMPAVNIDGAIIPANPYDARQMVDYLSQNPSEAKPLIWTLNQELTPIYALEPVSGFAADIYETLVLMLAGQIQPEDSDDFVERVSIPARLTDRTVELFSGQVVPVITLTNTRGMYGWKVNSLVDAALQTVITEATAPQEEIAMRKALSSFLNRVYYDLQNLGKFAKDRALNFSVTNAFQAASSFSQAISTGMQLDSIEVEKSPFCRINSDCWDVKLKFFDPENGRRARRVFLFTIDVSDRIPVTLGQVRSWSVRK